VNDALGLDVLIVVADADPATTANASVPSTAANPDLRIVIPLEWFGNPPPWLRRFRGRFGAASESGFRANQYKALSRKTNLRSTSAMDGGS
jgi:hypothetical protein